jgi:hypothetical protein
MKRLLLGGVFLALAAVAWAGVKTDYDPSARFGEYHTFAWKASDADPSGVANNSLVEDRVQEAVSRALVNKGLREDQQKPDIYMSYSFSAKERADVDPSWWGWRRYHPADVYYYTEGTLMLDMIDAKTNQLVWRAHGTSTGNDLMDVQAQKKIDKLVSDAFKKFPPEVKEKG